LPLVLLVPAGVEVFAWVRERIPTAGAPVAWCGPDDPAGQGLLTLLVIVVALAVPALLPASLVTFPPPSVAAVPFLLVLAAAGIDRLTIAVQLRIRAGVWGVVTGVVSLTTWTSASTASANFAPWLGIASDVYADNVFRTDGSELAALVSSLQRLNVPEVPLSAPDVPASYWRVLGSTGRLPLRVVPSSARDAYELSWVDADADAGDEPAVAEVRHGRLSLWRLSAPESH
jgi:hypothetical protein